MGAAAPERFDRLDALRAVAIIWMALFHFAFDLNHFGLLTTPPLRFHSEPVWARQRVCILSLFLFCAGLGQAVAWHMGQGWPRFWRRWGQVAGCALLVTAGSALMFPRSFIYFGVLHGMAVMLLIMRLTAGWGRWLWLAGAVAVALPRLVQDAMFNVPWLNWIGLVTRKPVTEDYVPLLPWIGVMWWGLAAGQWLLAHRRHWVAGAVPASLRRMSVLGRWSLTFYMVHQPVLIGAIMAWKELAALVSRT